MPTQRSHVSMFTRLRAWYVGAENAEVYSRYGNRDGLYHVFQNWKGFFIASACFGTVIANRSNNNWATESLQHAELNRARHYKQDFHPEYNPATPQGLYDGAVGYQFSDSATGLRVNADNKITAPSRNELRETFEKNPPVVSPEMVRAARALLEARTQGEAPSR